MKTIDPITQETCRGFHVHVDAPATRYRKALTVVYPMRDYPAYTGRQAIAILEGFAGRGLACRAWTTSPDPEGETLTLAEMREVVL